MENSSLEHDRTWTIKDVEEHPLARKFGISERQIRRAVQRGLIGFARPGGLVIRFTNEDIVTFVEASINAPLKRGGSK